jgi:hypothetical protein
MTDWELWRLTYRGGPEFRNKYLERFSNRENINEFNERKRITPTPSFAKSAINEIRNGIFQRMRDIVRRDGSSAFMRAVAGLDMGVDLRGSSMNYFMGYKVLTELLVMGKVGVYVDMPKVNGETKAALNGARPYLYLYQTEDILSWACSKPEAPSEFQSLLLRDTVVDYDRRTLLPLQTFERFRRLWIDQDTGYVNCQFYNLKGDEVDAEGNLISGPTVLKLHRIPFVVLDIGDSLIKDVAGHQIALMNLLSSDVAYALKSNFPFYIEQSDLRGGARSHLKQSAAPDGSATTGGQGAETNEVKVGVTQGRYYDIKANPPAFIAPPSEPLMASMKLAEKLQDDIRRLVNLAVQNLGQQQSATGGDLESGLSFIGLTLENGERRIGEFWADYESVNPQTKQIPVVKYPETYSIKSEQARINESQALAELVSAIPGQTVKRELAKAMVSTLLGGKIGVDVLDTIYDEIDEADYTTSDPNTIIQARTEGIIGDQAAAMALGFDEDEYLVARNDHAARLQRIMLAQTPYKVPGFGAPSPGQSPPINPWQDTYGPDLRDGQDGYGPTQGTTAGAQGPTETVPGESDPLATIGLGNSNASDPGARNAVDLSNPPRPKNVDPLAIEQQGTTGNDPRARGLKDFSADPNAGKKEKAASRSPNVITTGKRVRGKGKRIKKGPK